MDAPYMRHTMYLSQPRTKPPGPLTLWVHSVYKSNVMCHPQAVYHLSCNVSFGVMQGFLSGYMRLDCVIR